MGRSSLGGLGSLVNMKIANKKLSSAKQGVLRFLAFFCAPLFCVLFYAQCSTKITPCDGDPTADPEFDCLPFSPELSEPEHDGTGYKIPLSGVDGLDNYKYEAVCFTSYMEEADVDWEAAEKQELPASETHIDVGAVSALCFYRVRSCNQYGCGRWSDVVRILGGLVAPGGLRVSDETPDPDGVFRINSLDYTIAWGAVPSADRSASAGIVVDRYEYKENEGGGLSVGSSLSVDRTQSLFGGTYAYQVRICGYVIETSGDSPVVECGAWSSSLGVELRPSVPKNLGFDSSDSSPVTDGSYGLTWDTVDAGAGTYYTLQERQGVLDSGSFSAWADLGGQLSSNSYTVNQAGAAFQKDYQYQVRACASNDACSQWSSASGTMSLKFSQPVLGSIAPDVSGSYTVGWASVIGANGYVVEEVQYDEASSIWPGFTSSSAPNTTPNSYAVSGKSSGDKFRYRVKACFGSTCGDYSDVSGDALIPSLPGELNLKKTGHDNEQDNSYSISWDSVSGAERYELKAWEGGQTEPAAYVSLVGTTAVSKAYPSQAYQKSYRYKMRACAGLTDNCTLESTLTVNVRLAQPSLTDAGVDSPEVDGRYTLSWSSVANASKHVLQRQSRRSTDSSYGAWSELGKYDAGNSYDGTSHSLADSDYKYRLGACVRVDDADFNFSSDCRISPVIAVRVSFPTLAWLGSGGLGAIQNTGPSNNKLASYTIDWGEAGAAETVSSLGLYEVQEALSSDFSEGLVFSGTSVSGQYELSSKKYGPVYYYRVRGCVDYDNSGSADSTECGAWSPVLTVRATELIPSFTVSAASGASITDKGSGDYGSTVGDYGLDWSGSVPAYNYLSFSGLEKCGASCGSASAVWSAVTGVSGASHDFSAQTGSASYRMRVCNSDSSCGSYAQVSVSVGLPLSAAAAGLASDELPNQNISHDGSYSISWNSVARALNYALIETVDGVVGTRHVLGTGLSKAFTGRVYGKTYSYSVAACLGDGSTADNSCKAQTGSLSVEVKPSVPAGLSSASLVGHDGSYALSWTSLPAVSGYALTYKIKEIKKSGGAWPQWTTAAGSTVTASRHSVSGKGGAEQFRYRAQACYGDVCGGWSAFIEVQVPVLGAPVLSLENKSGESDNSYNLSWASVSGSGRYELKAWEGSQTSPGEPPDSDCQDASKQGCQSLGTVLTKAYRSQTYQQSYFYKLRACAGSNCSPFSSLLAARVMRAVDASTITANPAVSSDGTYAVSWGSVADVARYEIGESYDGGASWSSIVRVNSALAAESFTKSAPAGHSHALGRSYQYRIRACGDSNSESAANTDSSGNNPRCSAWVESSASLVRTGLAQVTGLVSDEGSSIDDAYNISWSSVVGAERYEVQEKIEGSNTLAAAFSSLNRNVKGSLPEPER